MKSKLFFLIILMFFNSVIYNAQSISGGAYSGDKDSLSFDGTDATEPNLFKETNDCKIKIGFVFGKVTGTYYLDTVLGDVCGVIDSARIKKTGQLRQFRVWGNKNTTMDLVPGTEVTTGGLENNESGIPNPSMVVLNVEGTYVTMSMNGSLTVGNDCVVHIKSGNVNVSGPHDIVTPRSSVSHKQTQYTIEVVEDGDKITDVVKVYEGSVELKNNILSDEYKQKMKKKSDELSAETKQLTEDIKNGKIAAGDYAAKIAEIQNKTKEMNKINVSVTIQAGYKSTITDIEPPTEPEPFDTSENRFWENVNK